MLQWRSIKELGNPMDQHIDYLVTDGINLAVSSIHGISYYESPTRFVFKGWTGCEFTYEDNQCCSGEKIFDMTPTHWCPATEVNLPRTKEDGKSN